MSSMVQVAVADDLAEAGEIQALLEDAGIESEVRPDDESDSIKVLVPDAAVEAAQDVIELRPPEDETLPEV